MSDPNTAAPTLQRSSQGLFLADWSFRLVEEKGRPPWMQMAWLFLSASGRCWSPRALFRSLQGGASLGDKILKRHAGWHPAEAALLAPERFLPVIG